MSAAAVAPARTGRWLLPVFASLIVAFAAWSIAYLIVATPGPLMGGAPTEVFRSYNMAVTRGAGRVELPFLVIEATDDSKLAVVSVQIPVAINAADYRRVRWVL